MEPKGVTVKQAAEILGCCERTVRNEIDNGTLKAYRVGKRGIRIPVTVLLRRTGEKEVKP
jgi:excisionase family DNA binding protein